MDTSTSPSGNGTAQDASGKNENDGPKNESDGGKGGESVLVRLRRGVSHVALFPLTNPDATYEDGLSTGEGTNHERVGLLHKEGAAHLFLFPDCPDWWMIQKSINDNKYIIGGIWKSWRRRWFVLDRGQLVYYRSSSETVPCDPLTLQCNL